MQRGTHHGGSHSLPVQRNFVWDSSAELRENIPAEVHSVRFVLRGAAEYEAHLHLHGAGLLLLLDQILLPRHHRGIHQEYFEARQCGAAGDGNILRSVRAAPPAGGFQAVSVQARPHARLLGAELLGALQLRRQSPADRQEGSAGSVEHRRTRPGVPAQRAALRQSSCDFRRRRLDDASMLHETHEPQIGITRRVHEASDNLRVHVLHVRLARPRESHPDDPHPTSGSHGAQTN